MRPQLAELTLRSRRTASPPLNFGVRRQKTMQRLKVTITRFLTDYQPGVVECSFSDAFGNTHRFIEKVPIVSSDDLWWDSEYPREGEIACTVLESWVGGHGEPLVRVDTELPWHVESAEGETIFVVPASLVTDTS